MGVPRPSDYAAISLNFNRYALNFRKYRPFLYKRLGACSDKHTTFSVFSEDSTRPTDDPRGTKSRPVAPIRWEFRWIFPIGRAFP